MWMDKERKGYTLWPKVALRAAAEPKTMSMAVQRGLRWGMTSACAFSAASICATTSSATGTEAASIALSNLHRHAPLFTPTTLHPNVAP